MKGYFIDLEKATLENDVFRKVLYTSRFSQLVLMSLLPGEEIGEEVHELDQFIRFEAGVGKVFLDEQAVEVEDGSAVIIPAGVRHNVVNMSQSESLKLYSVYSPPEHKDGVIHKTKQEALVNEQHFDGVLSQ